MTTGGTSAREGVRAIIRRSMSAEESAVLRKAERILDARALGHRCDRIAYDLKLIKSRVVKLIAARRATGDPRALTDKQAAAAAQVRQERQDRERAARKEAARRPVVAAPIPPAPWHEPIATIARPDPSVAEDAKRMAYVARVHCIADAYSSARPAVAAGLRHFADLHQHCDRFYPSLPIPSGEATLESTRRMFPPVTVVASGGGAAAACLAG